MKKIKQALDDYLLWMISSGYADKTIENYQQVLEDFVHFVEGHKIHWDNVFSSENLEQFHQITKRQLTAVRGLCRYLVKQKRINAPTEKQKHLLADVYEAYLHYYATVRQVNNRRIKSIRRVLAALENYLENKKIKLTVLTIEHLDAFFAKFIFSFSR